jgi:hypothetical protein
MHARGDRIDPASAFESRTASATNVLDEQQAAAWSEHS